jgi:hypothetical protein
VIELWAVEAFCLKPVIACLFFVAGVLSLLEMQVSTIYSEMAERLSSLPTPSSRIMAAGATEPLIEANTRSLKVSKRGECSSRFCAKCIVFFGVPVAYQVCSADVINRYDKEYNTSVIDARNIFPSFRNILT